MLGNLVDLGVYRFGKSIGIMVLVPDGREITDHSFLDFISDTYPDICLCVAVPSDMDDVYSRLGSKYPVELLLETEPDHCSVMYSRYPVGKHGFLYSTGLGGKIVHNISIGPDGFGLNIVFINGKILSSSKGLGDFWFGSDKSSPVFMADHSFMVSRGLALSENKATDSSHLQNSGMYIVYNNYRIV